MSCFKKGLDKFLSVFDHTLCFFGVIFYLTFVACVLIQVISRNLPAKRAVLDRRGRALLFYLYGRVWVRRGSPPQ
mgnify:CR=1 FL=1